jgi:LmbE family N-acetylglucosaminyl deacetylase
VPAKPITKGKTTVSSYSCQPNETVAASHGVSYAYRDVGEGDVPLVLLQHFRGNLDNWDPALVDDLAATRRVITFDNAGVGGSTGTTPHVIEQMAHDAIEFTVPGAGSVLAVTARPGKESEDLGGLLYAFRRAGTGLSLLCLTRGEASPHNTASARLEAIRPWELQLAAAVLGISQTIVGNYPDGALHQYPAAELTSRIQLAIRQHSADLVLVIAPEAGDREDSAVADAARAAAAQAGVPVVARTWPGALCAWTIDLGAEADTARAIQRSAAAAHTSQSDSLPALIRRLDLAGSTETLRWL